jgi:hypothetical protein
MMDDEGTILSIKEFRELLESVSDKKQWGRPQVEVDDAVEVFERLILSKKFRGFLVVSADGVEFVNGEGG